MFRLFLRPLYKFSNGHFLPLLMCAVMIERGNQTAYCSLNKTFLCDILELQWLLTDKSLLFILPVALKDCWISKLSKYRPTAMTERGTCQFLIGLVSCLVSESCNRTMHARSGLFERVAHLSSCIVHCLFSLREKRKQGGRDIGVHSRRGLILVLIRTTYPHRKWMLPWGWCPLH